jgi:hypothetical protein
MSEVRKCPLCNALLHEGASLTDEYPQTQSYSIFFHCEACQQWYEEVHRDPTRDPAAVEIVPVTESQMNWPIFCTQQLQSGEPAFQLKEEIARKADRLHSLPYLVTKYRKENDYECYWSKYLRLVEGFADKAAAIQYVDELTEETLAAAYADDWELVPERSWKQENMVSQDQSLAVYCVYSRGIELYSRQLWEKRLCQFEVLQLTDPDLFEEGLCTYYAEEFLKGPEDRLKLKVPALP